MKKLLFAGAVFASVLSLAQQTRFGAKAGYAHSTVKVTNSETSSILGDIKLTKPSFYIGGLVEHKFNDKFALQGELLYSQLGGKYEKSISQTDPDLGTVTAKLKAELDFSTLILPVSAKYYVIDALAFSGGVNFNYIMNAHAKSESHVTAAGIEVDENKDDEDITSEVNTFTVSPFVGAEYNINQNLFVDARYNFGVMNLIKDADKEDGKLIQNALMVGVGYKF